VKATASASPNLEASDWWLELGLLAALIAGLSWFLRRRSGEAALGFARPEFTAILGP
jgi:hypothetical protein